MPHRAEAAVKPISENRRYCLRPNRSLSQAVSGMMTTFAQAYPVETHPASDRVAPRFPWMSGRATLTMLVSITSRTAPSAAVIAITHLSTPRSSSRAATGESRLRSEP